MGIQISMGAQKQYEEAIRKYGKKFADAVVAHELQLHADGLDCFDEYTEYTEYCWMHEFIKPAEKP